MISGIGVFYPNKRPTQRVGIVPDREVKPTYSITVRATDGGGLFTDKVFTITVTNVNEAPTSLSLTILKVG